MSTPIPINRCAFRLDEVAAATGGEMFGAPETIAADERVRAFYLGEDAHG